jgi:hypothetical protein
VLWRYDDDYCGWAPLPPFAVFRPGFGFFYRGAAVSLDFDFGLEADYFVFISPDHFCDRHPRSFFVAQQNVLQVYQRTKVVNNFNVNSKIIENRGIAVDRITSATHHAVETVHVSSLPNAGRQGWRGEGFQRAQLHSGLENDNRYDSAGHVAQGYQPGQPQGYLNQPPQPARRVDTYATPDRVIPRNPLNEGQLGRDAGASAAGATVRPGAEQFQPRQDLAPVQPREEGHESLIQPGEHNSGQPELHTEPQPHNSGNGSNNNSNKGTGSNKQDH